MKLEAPAKINLHLAIAPKEEGERLHRLLSLFAPLSLMDTLELQAETADRPSVLLSVSDPELPCDERNIAVRAAKAWLRESGLSLALTLHVEKRIPMAAGLGGGSSDAAAVLRGLQAWAGAQSLPREPLLRIALELGSDVPYFLGAGLALVSGRGDELEGLGAAEELPLLLYVPDAEVATMEAFQALDEGRLLGRYPSSAAAVGDERRAQLRSLASDPGQWDGAYTNDFQAPCFQRLPQLAEAAEQFTRLGSFFVRLSGSGPSLFALFHSLEERDRALAVFQEGDWEGQLFSLSLSSLCCPGME